MSRLVILEGWIKQKNKNKEFVEVYAVLTKSHLKVYKSQINFKQRPDETLKVLNLTDSYNILPVLFDSEFTFSVFKKGERAMDRLYLNASSKIDYDTWLNQIEAILSSKTNEPEPCANGPNPSSEPTIITEPIEKSSNLKPTFQSKNSTQYFPAMTRQDQKDVPEKHSKSETDSNKTHLLMDELARENEKLKMEFANCEKELKNLKENSDKSTVERVNQLKIQTEMETKLKKANDEIQRLKSDKQTINDKKIGLEKEIDKLKKSVKENNEAGIGQFGKIVSDFSTKIHCDNVDMSSYMFCVDNLIDQNKPSSIVESLLKSQLMSLVHKCPIDLHTNVTLLDYLTVNIDLSPNAVIQFLSKLLVSLANCINKSEAPKSDLDPKVVTMIKDTVTMTKVTQKIDPQLNLNQILLEIAYILTKRNNFKSPFANGRVNDDSCGIDNKFDTFLKSHKLESIKKLMIVELGQQIKEKYQSKSGDKEKAKTLEIMANKTDPILHSYLNNKWNDTLKKLDQKELEIQDLYITIQQLSSRILTLEGDSFKNTPMFPLDEIVNIYSMNAEMLCVACQSEAVNLLEMPIIQKINTIVADFQSYWKSILNVHSLLSAKQQFNSGLRDLFEKMTQSTLEFDNLMKRFSDITQRSIENPSLTRPCPIFNDR